MRYNVVWSFVVALSAVTLVTSDALAAGWTHWHGNPLNTGFVDVVTAPAEKPQSLHVGSVANGAGPVVGSDGMVYLATLGGLVSAFDGRTLSVKWTRQLLSVKVLASPVIGADSLYVVCVTETGSPGGANHAYQSKLYRLDARTGEIRFKGLFPIVHDEGGFSSAAPTLWRDGTLELAMVPVNYRRQDGSYTNNIVVFSMGGIAIENQLVAFVPPPLPSLIGLPTGRTRPIVWSNAPPMPSLALYGAENGRQQVVAADGFRRIVVYDYAPDDTGLRERARKQLLDSRTATPMSSPMMLAVDGHSVVRVGAFAYFGPPSPVNWPSLRLTTLTRASVTPTALGDGRFAFPAGNQVVVAQFLPSLVVIRPFNRPLRTPTHVAAAASRNHLYVSTRDGLVTFSTRLMGVASEFLWSNGGSSPAAIAADGSVYAHANETLFAFPPPPACTGPHCGVRDRPNRPPAEGTAVSPG